MSEGPRPEIERALRFIGEHLDRPISVAEVARAARLSPFHLHRVFHPTLGESIGRFITRRRLEQAALRLAYEPDATITEIALDSGYSSSSNFSKAFAGYFGCSPTRVREPELALPPSVGKLAALYGKDFRPEELYSLPPPTADEAYRQEAAQWDGRVRYEEVEARSLACLAIPGGYDPERIERGWHDLIGRAINWAWCGATSTPGAWPTTARSSPRRSSAGITPAFPARRMRPWPRRCFAGRCRRDGTRCSPTGAPSTASAPPIAAFTPAGSGQAASRLPTSCHSSTT
jgi:AraC-like DNA-binding protein